jgi:hypothetical protein
VFVNEDNNGEEVFDLLERRAVQLCYASPETLLKTERFKKLFRNNEFRTNVPAIFLNEAHVLPEWQDKFRTAYSELVDIRKLCSNITPWGALSATMPTAVFESVWTGLKMGVHRPTYVLDLGLDRPNIHYHLQPLWHAITSGADIVDMLHDQLAASDTLDKRIIYLPTRALCVSVTHLLQNAAPHLGGSFWPFMSLCSDEYKTVVLQAFRDNLVGVRWLLATSAAGMGLDVPDIDVIVLYGVRRATAGAQEGGWAVRDPRRYGQWIWMFPAWMLEPEDAEDEDNVVESKQQAKQRETRENADPAAIELVNCLRTKTCIRSALIVYCRPMPKLPGFPNQQPTNKNEKAVTYQKIDLPSPIPPVQSCCRVCVEEQAMVVDAEEPRASSPSPMLQPRTTKSTPSKSCLRADKEVLEGALIHFRAECWASICDNHPFFNAEWIISDNSIARLLAKGHVLLSTPSITLELTRELAKNPEVSDENAALIQDVLIKFRQGVEDCERNTKHRTKKARVQLDDDMDDKHDGPFNVYVPYLAQVDYSLIHVQWRRLQSILQHPPRRKSAGFPRYLGVHSAIRLVAML